MSTPMKWDHPPRESSEFFEDFIKKDSGSPSSGHDRNKEKPQHPKVGPLWEVDDSRPSEFVKDFFKPA